MAEQKVRQSPRMTINALAQYVTAPAPRRERILRDQKYPSDYRVIWYDQAARTMLRYLLDVDHDPHILTDAAQRIRERPAADKNEAQKLRDNADALVAFHACCDQITFDSLQCQRANQDGHLLIEGVTISVRPEVVLSGPYRGSESLGGIKLYLSKNLRLDSDGLDTIGAVLHMLVRRDADEGTVCATRHCTVVDVFGRTCSCAPRAVVRRQRDVEAACREIASRWPNI